MRSRSTDAIVALEHASGLQTVAMTEPLVFSPSFEALLRALGGSLNDASKEQFRKLGVDYDQRLLPAYSLDVWVAAMELGSSLLTPNGSQAERHYALGRRMVDSYGETLIGRALLAVMRVIGPRRSFERMTRNLRTTNNYTDSSFEASAEGQVTLWCSKVVSPEFYRGMFSRTLEAAGGTDARVKVLSADASGCKFAVSWKSGATGKSTG